MTVSYEVVPSDDVSLRTRRRDRRSIQRPSFRYSDFWKAPLSDFPIRDEILYQYVPFSADMDVLEIGPGSGFTAFRLSRLVRHMTVVDVTSEVVADLAGKLRAAPNLTCVCADASRPGLARQLGHQFDAAFGLDVFEYLVDGAVSLRNLAEVLRPDGELFLTFPNLLPPEGDGVTHFSHLGELEAQLKQAGFRRWEIFAARRRPFAAGIYRVLHEWPLSLLRRMSKKSRNGTRPQTYEKTWAFRRRLELSRFRFFFHLYWTFLGRVIRLGGQVFAYERATREILGKQIVVRAWK